MQSQRDYPTTPVRPVRDPPRLDAFGNQLPDEWLPLNRNGRSIPSDRAGESLEFYAAQLLLVLRALFSREAQDQLFGDGAFAGRAEEKIYSVPRRFDISTLFVVSMAFAFLFAILGYCGLSSLAKLGFCFYISGVGFAQAALFGSRAPRLSSVLAGGILLAFITALLTLWEQSLVTAIAFGTMALIFGLPSGYLVGTVCGGVFLVADKVRQRTGW